MLKEIKSKIEKTEPEDVRLYFITRKKTGENIEYNVLKTEITKQIGNTLLDIGKNMIDDLLGLEDLKIIDYSPLLNLEQNNIQTIDKNKVPFLDPILVDIARADLDSFDINQSRNLWAYGMKLGDSEIVMFKKYTEKRILDRKGWIPLFVSDGKFNQISGSILTIDEDIDCLVYKNKVYILNSVNFEKIFSFMDKFIEEIDASFNIIKNKNIVDDANSLQELCKSDPRKIKKLNKILKGDVVASLNLKKIKQLNKKYNLDLNFTDNGKLIVNSENIWTVLKVLDDDYLKSPTTDNKYEAHSKVKKT